MACTRVSNPFLHFEFGSSRGRHILVSKKCEELWRRLVANQGRIFRTISSPDSREISPFPNHFFGIEYCLFNFPTSRKNIVREIMVLAGSGILISHFPNA